MATMTIDMTVKFGDLLTSVSVLIAALTLSYGWWKDRSLRRRERADAVRTAAAHAFAKLEHWVDLAESFGDQIQGLLVETTHVVDSHGDRPDFERGRDYLWGELHTAWWKLSEELRALEMESAAVDLFGRGADAYDRFQQILAALKDRADAAFAKLRDDTQDKVLTYDQRYPGRYERAKLGNELRGVVKAYEDALKSDLTAKLAAAEAYLSAIIQASDAQVLDRSWRPTAQS